MKFNTSIKYLLAILMTSTLSLSGASAKSKEKTQAQLLKQAKITKTEAQKTALTKAPDGTVKDGELEEEHGLLIWSFDIARPGTKNITEVAVNAITGKIVSTDIERPQDQAKEAKEDAAKEAAQGKKD